MKRNVCLTILVVVASVQQLLGANYKFLHINSQNGLPHQQVEALAQDAKGNLWIGTRNGLSRYDGYNIYTYYHNDEANSLTHNMVHALLVDKKQRLWVATENGICRYRSKTDDFRCYSQPQGLFWSMTEDNEGNIFFGGMTLCRYNEEKDTIERMTIFGDDWINALDVDNDGRLYVATNTLIFHYDKSFTKIMRLPAQYYADFMKGNNVIVPMHFDSKGRLWVGRNGQGAMCIDTKKGTSKVFPPGQISSGFIRCITEDHLHRIWLGTEKGITIIHPDGKIEILQHEYHNIHSLSDNAVYSILFDRDRNVWIGSYFGGIDYLLSDYEQFQVFEPGDDPASLKARVPRNIIEPEPGIFWIATEDGGINIYDRKTSRFTVFNGIPGMGNNIHALHYDRNTGEIWIGTRFEGLYRYNIRTHRHVHYLHARGLDAEGVFYFAQQKNGRMWIATMQGLRYYDPASDLFRTVGNSKLDKQFIYTLHIDNDDNLWVGTINSGIFHINHANQKVTGISKESGKGLLENYIISLFRDSRGILWIGTNNSGLQYLNTKTGIIQSLDDEKFRKATICSIEEDNSGALWISTSQGLFRYDPATHAVNRFTAQSNGLPSNQFNYASSMKTADGTMLFGTINGLIAFRPQNVKVNNGPFYVHLRKYDDVERIVLSHDQASHFVLDYGVIMPSNSSTIRYQVWLEGIDKRWRDVYDERRFSSFNLPAGSYRLHIRANNSNEGWERCPEKVITIVVRPPFYRSTWAYLLYLLVLAAISWFAWRLFLVRMREKNDVRIANMEREKLRELDAVRQNFFTIASHELKTPLSLIIAPLKSISNEGMSQSQQKSLDMAIKNAAKMEQLVGELITFNKVETDSFPFFLQKGNPLDFIELALQPFRMACSDQGLTLTVKSENNGEDVWFSPSYLEHILYNLMSNALKYTNTGGIDVNASITNHGNDTYNYLRLDVSDTGIGIVAEELEHIFDRYYQTKRGYNANNNGWGIGLSLVKHLVEVQKGEIRVESAVGKGTTFTVWLNVSDNAFNEHNLIRDDSIVTPIEQYRFSQMKTYTLATTDNTATTAADKAADKPLTLLIVDDNNDLREFLDDFFSPLYNVVTAANGKEALQLTHDHEIQLVIADVMMPEMDGIELCRQLKNDMQTSHIPVILLTAKSENEDVVQGYQSGAEAYVAKPFDPQILQLQVNNILQLVKKRQQQIVEGDTDTEEATTLSPLDKTFVQKMNQLVEDNIANSDFSITDITTALAISRSLLHIKMKNILNMSMGDYIRKKRLDKACQMLRQGYNVSETAYATGFSDPNYFSKTFKKHIGMSPTDYCHKTTSSFSNQTGRATN
ncbi:MAG: response regulator [Prevotella sp.]|nr:response regulator [Prevotella sp.]